MRAILTVGISASGKTTWANEFINSQPEGTWRNINRDDIRADIMATSGITPVWRNWKWKWEDKVTAQANALIEVSAQYGRNVIISDTNLSAGRFDAMVEKLQSLGYTIEIKSFDITFDEAVKRDNERHNGVGYSVIQEQHQKFLDLSGRRVQMNPTKPTAVIVDIDGTVALMNGKRGPFEWHNVGLDDPHQPVIEMVKGLSAAGHLIIFTSGRDGSCRDLTTTWLKEAFGGKLPAGCLLMRAEGDQRKDTIVKEEIFRRDILNNYNVVVVLDDRPSVCRMWRDLGLNVVQVGNPYIEF